MGHTGSVTDHPSAEGALYPNPDTITNVRELGYHLRLLRISVGAPSLRTLQRYAADRGQYLPRSTAANAESGRHAPSLETVLLFVEACGVAASAEKLRWRAAWQRAYASRQPQESLQPQSLTLAAKNSSEPRPAGMNPVDSEQLRLNMLERLHIAESFLGSRIFGQPQAVRLVVDYLSRALTGLAAPLHGVGETSVPPAIWLVGPAGVGKRAMAQAVSELLFGSTPRLVEMSDFGRDHSADELFGPPPGYVGYERGGVLLNLVRNDPGVVILNEIQAGSGHVLDKLSTVLEGGTLQDGVGPVSFQEMVLIAITTTDRMTWHESNAVPPRPDMPYEEHVARMRTTLEDLFLAQLNRRRLFYGLQRGMVPFGFLPRDAGGSLARRNVKTIVERVATVSHVSLEFATGVEDDLVDMATSDLSLGGRGVANLIEAALLNPLSRIMANRPPATGGTLRILAIERGVEGWSLRVEWK